MPANTSAVALPDDPWSDADTNHQPPPPPHTHTCARAPMLHALRCDHADRVLTGACIRWCARFTGVQAKPERALSRSTTPWTRTPARTSASTSAGTSTPTCTSLFGSRFTMFAARGHFPRMHLDRERPLSLLPKCFKIQRAALFSLFFNCRPYNTPAGLRGFPSLFGFPEREVSLATTATIFAIAAENEPQLRAFEVVCIDEGEFKSKADREKFAYYLVKTDHRVIVTVAYSRPGLDFRRLIYTARLCAPAPAHMHAVFFEPPPLFCRLC